MTTKINASTAGLTETVDATGILEIQTANTAALIIDASQNANFVSTGAITVPNGTTAQRPTGSNGMIRYNSNTAAFEFFANNTWALANVTPPPVNTVAPVVSGSTAVGGTANVTTGTWNYSPTGYYYQWLANNVAISSNATANTFVITATEDGANLSCNVTAYNVAGNSSPVTSNSVGPVTSSYNVTYLVIAGGGGGGAGAYNRTSGGGGAGGYQTGNASVNPSTVYTITVGAGGGSNTKGSNSSALSITSLGGGYGGGELGAGTSGGSGGGGSGAGTAGQGNNGGSGQNAGSGGGGGAGSAGSNSPSSWNGGAGGSGASSSITGSAVTRAGGGGGGGSFFNGGSPGGGGSGGGGAGRGDNSTGGAGTANTGSGGGGTGWNGGGGGTGGTGGSGVVILSMPTASYSGVTTGSPTVTTSGSNTILQFNSSGSYTA